MASGADLVWQPSLLDAATPAVDASFSRASRRTLDARSWIDVVPGWVAGADALFADLLDLVGWKQRNRWMYERRVDEPRLTASWKDECGIPIHDAIGTMRDALTGRYGVEFDSGGLNLYRDGRDSVAWHGDRIDKKLTHPLVAIVSLGHDRPFRVRPKGGGVSSEVVMRRGDLLVTGGRMQREWDHAIPKVSSAGPRLSITFRHSDPSPEQLAHETA